MSNSSTILHKRSTTPGAVPPLTSLSAGELAISVADGKLFVKTSGNTIETFSNDSYSAFILDTSLSGVEPQYGNNSISQSFANVLGGYNNDVSGAASTTVNGEDNDIAGDLAFIGSGYNNEITSAGDYSAILAGQNNLISHQNSFAIGSDLISHAADFTYVNNISARGVMYGNGSGLTNLAAVVAPDTDVRALTANWESTYLTVSSLSASWASSSGEYLPLSGGALTGTITGDLSATGSFYGDGSNLTGIIAGDSEATTLVRSNSGYWDSTYTTTQTNSANWQTAYAYVSANSVNLTATNIFVTNDLTVTDTVSAKYYQGTLIDWMTLVRGTKTTPTLLATIGSGEVYTYVYSTATTDKTYYRYIATNGSEDSFYGNFNNPTLSNLIATKKIIL